MEIGGELGVDVYGDGFNSSTPTSEEDMDLRRGPWTVDEDLILINYIATHGEGRWNSLARCAGLKRTGKSCRLRWLNYLRPDVRRGNITPEEQLLILELHSRWGNRWSKIAQHLPGRTDNEIKNYWRTRVQKHAKQLKCDVNSKQFKDVMRYLWMPRLIERIRAAKNTGSTAGAAYNSLPAAHMGSEHTAVTGCEFGQVNPSPDHSSSISTGHGSSSMTSLDSSVGTHISSPLTVTTGEDKGSDWCQLGELDASWPELLPSPCGYANANVVGLPEFDWWASGDFSENLWSMEDNWLIQQQQL